MVIKRCSTCLTVSSWFKTHRVRVMQYFDEKNSPCKPDSTWWLILLLIANISEAASNTFRSLQGLSTLLSAQRQGLMKLQATYVDMFGATPALDDDDHDENL